MWVCGDTWAMVLQLFTIKPTSPNQQPEIGISGHRGIALPAHQRKSGCELPSFKIDSSCASPEASGLRAPSSGFPGHRSVFIPKPGPVRAEIKVGGGRMLHQERPG